MSDAELTRRWRFTERVAEASLALSLVIGIFGCPIAYDWPEWVAWNFMMPLWGVSIVFKTSTVLFWRPLMARRGLDWHDAPVWWVR